MAILLFANNIQTTLATSITASQTSVTLTSTAGLPSPTAGQYFVMTFTSGNTNEIVWVTNVTGSTITCIRGKEGTSASTFASGSYASCFPTAGTQQNFVQIDQLQNGAYTFANGAGTANVLTATIASNLTATALPNGFQFVINAANANTGAATLNLTLNPVLPGSGATTSTGALPIYKNGNSPLSGGEITGSNYLCLFTYNANYNGGAGAFVLENPFNAVTGVVGITQLQSEYFIYNVAGGSSDSLTLTVPAGLATLTDGATVTFRNTVAANTTTTPTLNVTYGAIATGATTIKKYANQALSVGDTGGVGYICQLVYSSAASAWMLLNPAPGTSTGVTGITAGSGIGVSGTGNVTVSNTGVLSINGKSGVATLSSTDLSALNYATSSPQTVTGSVTFASDVISTGFNVSGGSFLGTNSLQLGSNAGYGLYLAGGVNTQMVAGGGSDYIAITSTNTLITTATDCYKTGSGTAWIIASDSRLKQNITSYTKGLIELNQIVPKNWEYNGLGGTSKGYVGVGAIADELELVMPEMVGTHKALLNPTDTEESDIKNVDVSELTWLLVNSVKELNELVQTQAEEIAALKQKVGI
jgi:hypothetical protein